MSDGSFESNLPSPPTGLWSLGERLIRLSLWIIRRPFIAPQSIWAILAVVSAGAAVGLAGVGEVVIACVPAFMAAVSALVWIEWWQLGRGDDPVVVISPYSGRTWGAREAAGSQLEALRRFLTRSEDIADAGGVIVKDVSVPISGPDAKRLLRLRRVILVVRGTAESGGDVGYFRGEAHFRDDAPTVALNRHPLSIYVDGPKRSRLRRLLAGDTVTSMAHEEGDLELRRFASPSLRLRHFKAVAKVLLVLLSEKALEQPHRLRLSGTLILPQPDDDALDGPLQTRALQLEAETRRGREDPRKLLEALEKQVLETGLGGERAAMWLLAQWFAGQVEGWTAKEEGVVAAARWSDRHPTSHLLALNLAGMQVIVGDLEQAKLSVTHARKLGAEPAAFERLLGNIAWEEGDAARALGHYKRAAVRRGVLAWQIGDCYAALGNRSRSLRAYRAALRRDPFRVPAAEHARPVAGWPRLLPTFPAGWRMVVWRLMHRSPVMATPVLVVWRRLQPEDPYLATWKGRQALLRGRMRQADDWSYYATRFSRTNRLIAHFDQLIVLGLLADGQANDWAEFTARHMHWLADQGLPAVRDDAEMATREVVLSLASFAEEHERQHVSDLVSGVIGASR